MLKNEAYNFFIEKDNNCAEATLRSINKYYSLGLCDEDIKLVSAFGGGMGCGKTCGVLCACMAACGKLKVKERAHFTEGFADLCADFYKKFLKKLGSTQCTRLKKMYRNDEVRCLQTVELGLDLFEQFAEDNGLILSDNKE